MKLKPAEKDSTNPIKLTKKGKKKGENTFFSSKDKQPLISAAFANTPAKRAASGKVTDKKDSHYVNVIPIKTVDEDDTDEDEDALPAKKKKKVMKKKKPATKSSEQPPLLTESDNDSYHSQKDSEESDDEDEESLYRKAEKEGYKIPAYFKTRMAYYKKERDNFVKKCREENERIEKMKTMTAASKERLSKETMLKSLSSYAGIAKEQLDVSMHARTQLENHIFKVESENIKMRAMLQGCGVDVDSNESLLASDYNPHAEMINRSIEILCMLQGVHDRSTLAAMDDYINKRTDRDVLEKKMKQFIINGNKEKRGEDHSIYSPIEDISKNTSSVTAKLPDSNPTPSTSTTATKESHGSSPLHPVSSSTASKESQGSSTHPAPKESATAATTPPDPESLDETLTDIRSVPLPDPLIASSL